MLICINSRQFRGCIIYYESNYVLYTCLTLPIFCWVLHLASYRFRSLAMIHAIPWCVAGKYFHFPTDVAIQLVKMKKKKKRMLIVISLAASSCTASASWPTSFRLLSIEEVYWYSHTALDTLPSFLNRWLARYPLKQLAWLWVLFSLLPSRIISGKVPWYFGRSYVHSVARDDPPSWRARTIASSFWCYLFSANYPGRSRQC